MSASPDFFNQLKSILANLSPVKRVIFLTVVAAVITGFIFIISWTTNPEFGILYKNLSPEDAGVILSKLKENKVDYKISSNGTSISIPNDLIYEKRMELASQGLPQGGSVGFEIFDNTSLGVTEFVQNVNYQRALQGELSRTISKFDEVESARVHIVMPSRSLFIDRDELATASVVLSMRRSRMLSRDQVHGIVYLVSSSVSGLAPENVTVIDSNGNMLSGDRGESVTGKISHDQLEFKEGLEKSLEKRVKTMLDTGLGNNKSVVRISCSLNFKKQEKTEEKYYPENKVVRSEQLLSAISSGTDDVQSGIPGVSSNIAPVKNDASVSKANKNFEKKDQTVNYEIGKIINHIIEPVGAITRLSIAVMVDGKYEYKIGKQEKSAGNVKEDKAGKENKDNGEWIYIPRTKEEMEKLEGIVKRAVNFDAKRGDEIEIVNIPFETSRLTLSGSDVEPEGWLSILKQNKILLKYVFSVFTLLLAFIFIVRPLIRWLTSPGGDVELLRELPMTVGELEKGFKQQNKRLPFSEKALEMINTDTENSAKLMRNWLQEE
ncbi:flagellar M-ring protein FliF [Desulfosarcina sp. BuS5]|uniref:flagellar basal-body MS-ring/collar protein FliF n=1 Tax=Desulfosarcina sp. BuS5 TaxID=933262 RepID=UPI00068564D4|nr:flagellar basal-body MS-ring/collar protein FliF [Desulfosarcina sp. BuS5]WDN90048.1 flagellar M-ring protein FliF [Desulfosarcina sp. BuS5]